MPGQPYGHPIVASAGTLMDTNQTTLVEIRPFASVSDKISVLTPLKTGHMIARDFYDKATAHNRTNRPSNHGE